MGKAGAYKRAYLKLARAEAERRHWATAPRTAEAAAEKAARQEAHLRQLEAERALSEQRTRERLAAAEAHRAEAEHEKEPTLEVEEEHAA